MSERLVKSSTTMHASPLLSPMRCHGGVVNGVGLMMIDKWCNRRGSWVTWVICQLCDESHGSSWPISISGYGSSMLKLLADAKKIHRTYKCMWVNVRTSRTGWCPCRTNNVHRKSIRRVSMREGCIPDESTLQRCTASYRCLLCSTLPPRPLSSTQSTATHRLTVNSC